jgi:PmbA protein
MLHDEPRRLRGARSKPFDSEGVPTANSVLIDDGVLTTWLLDSRSARQLGLKTNGHCNGGSPGLSNAYFAPGQHTPAALMADIKEGIYVTELMGMGVNGITGDYSRGCAGFMIRDGALAEPVAEVTIAGNLKSMFAAMIPAIDLRFRRAVDAPTLRVDGMTLAGA